MMTTQQQTVQDSQNRKLQVEEILEKLRRIDSELFKRVVDAIPNQDDFTSGALASEVVGIRKVIVMIENAGADITSPPKYPELLLCPKCCSPEISISQSNAISKFHCLDCGKIWTTEMDNNKKQWFENVWSMA